MTGNDLDKVDRYTQVLVFLYEQQRRHAGHLCESEQKQPHGPEAKGKLLLYSCHNTQRNREKVREREKDFAIF